MLPLGPVLAGRLRGRRWARLWPRGARVRALLAMVAAVTFAALGYGAAQPAVPAMS